VDEKRGNRNEQRGDEAGPVVEQFGSEEVDRNDGRQSEDDRERPNCDRAVTEDSHPPVQQEIVQRRVGVLAGGEQH